MTSPTADVSVRVAWADDAPAVAALQVHAWQQQYDGLVPADALPDVDTATSVWRESLTRPKDARNRVLVGLERNRVVGFAVVTPASDPDCDAVADGELVELVVAASDRGQGHGSRLMQAVVDTMQADRFRRAVCWVIATDDGRRGFLSGAGWVPDGAHRELALDSSGEARVKQVRLHVALQ